MTLKNLFEVTTDRLLSDRLSFIVQSIQDSHEPSIGYDIIESLVIRLQSVQCDVLYVHTNESNRDAHEAGKFAVKVGLASAATIQQYEGRLYHFECVSRVTDAGGPMAYLSVYLVAKNLKKVRETVEPIFLKFDVPANALKQAVVSKRNG